MKIAQITPGNIPIPPNGWGAVEKIIWEYTQVLRKLGHQVDIVYTDDVKDPKQYDVVHVHMANLALILKERGIPYVFSHHDHHSFHFGKNSEVYKQNRAAIEGSVLTFVHAQYLVDYFGVPGKIRYLGHGANLKDYWFEDRSRDILENGPKLVMMANNGLGGNQFFDRKGFGPGIEAARRLKAPITILCRSEGNRDLLESFADYEGLNVIYDMDYEHSISELRNHNIFLNPSMLEAGHPNLTVTESIAMGIPVVGTSEREIAGTYVIHMEDQSVQVDDIVRGIESVCLSYSKYVLECKENRGLLSWEVVVSRLLMDYAKYVGISQKKMLMDTYISTVKREDDQNRESGFWSGYTKGPFLYKAKNTDVEVAASFIDRRSGLVFHKNIMGSGPRLWLTPYAPPDRFMDWRIEVRLASKIIYEDEMDLKNKHVFVRKTKGLTDKDESDLREFSKKTGCFLTLEEKSPNVLSFVFDDHVEDDFYLILKMSQVRDYFNEVTRCEERTLIKFLPEALGDNIGFMPYANEFGKKQGRKVYVISKHRDLFTNVYDHIEFVDDTDCTEYLVINYLFGSPLQRGFAEQLGLEYTEIRPKIRPYRKRGNGIKGKYICFSTHSTCQAKFWNANQAWMKLCDEFTRMKILPVCIDRYRSFGIDGHWNEIPANCVDKTGGDLDDMMSMIDGCEFFVGLSSGLAWVAHAMGKKVVMISGVTSPENEFKTDIVRIHNSEVCNSCFGKPEEHKFDPGNWLWCPIHRGTSREFECTKKISPKYVMDKIREAGLAQ